jgi:iron(III) transport system permease protein
VIALGFMILFLSFPNPIYGSIWIIVIAYIIRFLPQGSRFTHAAIVQIHKELEEASWASGANFWQTLRYVWLPLMLPALMNAGLYVAILSVKVMSIAAFLQSPDNRVLSVYLWTRWFVNHQSGSAISVVIVFGLALLTFITRRLGKVMMQGQEV